MASEIDFEKYSTGPSTAAVVWIATALLHQENTSRDKFSHKEIFQKAKQLGLLQVSDSTLTTHISSHCVANRKAQPDIHRKLLAVSNGWFRLYRPGDPYHPSREKGKITPSPEEIPQQYRYLLDWYETEYCKKQTEVDQKAEDSSSGSPRFSKFENENAVRLPQEIIKKLQLQTGDYIAFLQDSSGNVILRKAKIKLE
ncbi:MAG: AbrB/MazE/SpoVT family DNA-binding domain-containing protein [Thaumarchaeota archaeon]|nr:AbrB/MazE/SpoVT family DNA-binding domain-containing protein [Nitrososphaerota archaeon]